MLITNKKRVADNSTVLEGALEFGEIVGSTMGPNGSLVAIEGKIGKQPKFTKDGVSVARALDFTDSNMSIGALTLKEAAESTLAECGDGTTTTIVIGAGAISYALVSNDFTIPGRGKFLHGIDAVIDQIDEISTEATDDMKREIILRSCNGDKRIADLVIEAGDMSNPRPMKVTNAGKVKTTVTLKKGLVISGTLMSSYDIGPSGKGTFIVNHKEEGANKLFVPQGENVDAPIGEAFIKHNSKGKRETMLNYLLVALSELSPLKISWSPDEVIVRLPDDMSINDEISNVIKSYIDASNNKYDTLFYKDILAGLTTGIAVIDAGGYTVADRSEVFDRIEDAVGSFNSLKTNMVVRGMGLWANDIIDYKLPEIAYACHAPNMRLKESGVTFKDDIYDPAEVVKSAVRNGLTAASLLIHTKYVLTNAL